MVRGEVLYGVWCVAVRCGAVRCGAVRCGAVRCGAVRCGAVRCGAVRCGAVRCVGTCLFNSRSQVMSADGQLTGRRQLFDGRYTFANEKSTGIKLNIEHAIQAAESGTTLDTCSTP